jgi:asparagine synthase (glutamine-hydrolysing)
MLSVPAALKMHNNWSKFLLRKVAEKVLPKVVAWRKNKKGFESPVELWMSDKSFFVYQIKQSIILKNIIRKRDLNNIQAFPNKLLWKLYNIAVWEKQYKVVLECEE